MSLSLSQSTSPPPFPSPLDGERWVVGLSSILTSLTIFARLIEPRLQDSYGSRGCSPQGLVDSLCPIWGVGFESSTLSIKTMPGSPFLHACSTMRLKTSLAFRESVIFFVLGLIRS